MDETHSREKLWTREEMRSRLQAEAQRCVNGTVRRHCAGEYPVRSVFTLGDGELRDADAVVSSILRSDGWHRPDIRLGPIAQTDDAVVLLVSWEGDEWTNREVTGQRAFPGEPFILVGPPLPHGWDGVGEPPKVRLPRWPNFL